MDTSTEVWKAVPGYEGWYEASTEGRIRVLQWLVSRWTHTAPKVVVQAPLLYRKGYLKHQFNSCGKTRKPKRCYYHRIIFETFHGPIPEGMTVNHKDGDKANNRPENLELATHQEQHIHARALGLVKFRNGVRPKLTADDIRSIRRLYEQGHGYSELGRQFGVWPNAIKLIVRRITWAHVA